MPTLTPDSQRFRPLAVLKQGPARVVTWLEDSNSGASLVGHGISAPDSDAQRFEEEAETLAAIHHPSLPFFHSLQQAPQRFFFLFHYVEGVPLSEFHGTVPTAWALAWFRDILVILQELSRLGRGLGGMDPSDLVVHGSHLVLVDLGLHEALQPEASAMARPPERLQFMAPEERHVARISPAGDLYAAAGVAWWMLTGQAPTDPTREALPPDVPPVVADALVRMLQGPAASRWTDLEAVLAEITPWSPEPAGVPPAPARPYHVPLLETKPKPKPGSEDTIVDRSSHPTIANPYLPRPRAVREALPAPTVVKRSWALPIGVGVALLAALVSVVAMRRDASVPRSALMTVVSGHVEVHHPGRDPEWVGVPYLQLGDVDAQTGPTQETTLRFGRDSMLTAEAGTRFRLTQGWPGALHLDLVEGSFRLATDDQETVMVRVPQAQVECLPACRAVLRVAPCREMWTGAEIESELGTLGVELAREPNKQLPAGSAVEFDGSHWRGRTGAVEPPKPH